jgi:type IV pilus assembly protein PilM
MPRASGRACLFTRVSPSGLEAIAENLSDASGLSDEHARLWLAHVGLSQAVETVEGDRDTVAAARSALEAGASSVLDEVRLSLDFYGNQDGAAPVTQVLLSGPGSAIPGFAEWMAPTLGLPVSVGLPDALANIEPSAAARLTVPFGLALDS